MKVIEALRVNQLDAVMLDGEIEILLRLQYMKMFEFAKVGMVEKYKPELDAVLGLMLYGLSIVPKGTTYGNQLQNLVYQSEEAGATKTLTGNWMRLSNITRKQKLLFGILHILVPYVWTRLERYSLVNRWADCPPDDWRRSLFALLGLLEVTFKALSWLNLIVFLWNGQYVSLIDRLLAIRLVYQFKTMSRQVSFEFMNRQLIWSSFSEFIMFLMPLVNLDKIKRFFSRLLTGNRQHRREYVNENACPVCSASPLNTPFIAQPCGHRYCYYCLKTGMMVDKSFTCCSCGRPVISMSRLTVD